MNMSCDLSKGNIDGQLRWRENLKNHQNGIVATVEWDFTRQRHGSTFIEVWMTHILDLCSNRSRNAFDTYTGTRWLDSRKTQPQKICTVSWKNMVICRRYAHIRLRFFSRQMLELGETTLQLFRGILPAILKTNENQRLINDINQSIAQLILRTFCIYLSINRSIDRAILNLSEELHIFIILGIVAIGWFLFI